MIWGQIFFVIHLRLNEAVDFGFRSLSERGFESVLITHGDLVYPSGLLSLFEMEEIVIVPDSELDGTNVLVLPTNIDFEFSYGPAVYAPLEVCNHVGS